MRAVLLVLVLAVSLGMAGRITAMGDTESTGSSWLGTDAETVYWSQPPTGYAMGSQFFNDMYPEFDAGVADDFEFAEVTTINKIRWWGNYWAGSAGVPVDSPVEIYLYVDDGTGNAPTLPQHSSAIQNWMIDPGQYTEVLDGYDYMCTYEFPTWVVFDAGQKYWFEIRKAFPYLPFGQYGWVEAEPVTLSPCVQGFDGFGIVWWTPQTTDAAFELIFDDALALERETWANIKTMF
ncbi:MAG: hypothetical protein AVO35_06100 [Candidatus Aegiribacteria sp. MLS_C]|nr:MAG: hypothetical protein AVO35_06100 [Candidatus Aegiribacteria sp. MLS_C]